MFYLTQTYVMSKARIKQIAMKNTIRVWNLSYIDELDPIVRLFIDVFSTLINDTENSIEDITTDVLKI